MNHKFLWPLVAFLLYFLPIQAQYNDTVKVLFIGNSFTYYNNMPQMFEQLSNSAGHPVFILQHTPGGVSVGDTAQGSNAHMNNPTVFSLIRDYDWDFLVLQDNQGRFIFNYGVFPSASRVIEGHIKIRDSLLYHHPCAKMLWFAGWGPKYGYLPYASTGIGLIDRIHDNYQFLLDTAGQVIAPIGAAWKSVILQDSSINLWDVDDTHPGPKGSYLTAAVLYSSIFKSNALESTYTLNGSSLQEDSLFKQIAFQTVLDSITETNLLSITPTILQQGNNLSLTGFSQVEWYVQDSLLSTDFTFTPNADGHYVALASDSTGCQYLSLEYDYLFVNSVKIVSKSEWQAPFPNPCQGDIYLPQGGHYQLFDLNGKILLTTHRNSASFLTIDSYPAGIYVLKFLPDNGLQGLSWKIFKEL